MPAPASARPSRSFLRLGVVGGWLLFTLMTVAISWAGAVARGRQPALGGTLIWNLGWLFWIGGTFLVAWLARRFPLERGNLVRRIATHLVLGALVAAGMLVLEFGFEVAVARLWSGAPRANELLGFFVYKFHVCFLIYWMILGATRAYDFHAQYRASELLASQLETQLAHAQLAALKTQLQPHFLFNTHHAIISLMLKQENAAAIKMLTRLSDLLRLTLRATERQVCPLRDELDALELYLGIQRERYGDRLRVELAIDPATLDVEVPWLVLQPLVENALKHGIDALAGGGVLRIAARFDGEHLQLSVRDNGPGLPPGFTLASASGIGLRNTAARLARLYPDAARLEINSAAGGGAEVLIALPRHHAALAASHE